MERPRCAVHGLLADETGQCTRCRQEDAQRNARRIYAGIGLFAGATLVVLAGVKAATLVTAAATHEPPRPADERVEAPPSAPARAPATTSTAREREARIVAATHDVPVVIYTADYCGWCRKTKVWLDRNGIAYTERRVDTDAIAKREMQAKFGGGGIPAIDIEGELRQGYDPEWMARTLRARAAVRVGPG